MKKILNYIGGELIEPASGKFLSNYNPATAEIYSLVPDSDEADVAKAVESAQRAYAEWSNLPAEIRYEKLIKIAELISENLDLLAEAESNDTGKPKSLAKQLDIPRAASNFRFYATAIMHFGSESYETIGQAINYTLRQPIGVVGCISPWNLPLYLLTWKIAPALAAGNCVIAKPSELTPMTAFLLSELCIKAGLPPGVLNIVHGLGSKVGATIVRHPRIRAISFTGGTQTGKWIASQAAPMFKKLSLELGGKNPSIVFADCNYQIALQTNVRSSFLNQGEICLCSSRIFIEKDIYEKFRDDFVQKVKELKVGDPLDPATEIGAIVSKTHMEKILSYIDLAKEEGGRILTGGNRMRVEDRCENGYFIEPTVIEGLSFDCRTNQEEIFGPVVTLQPFDDENQVIQYANSVSYGLAAMIWTENLSRAHRLARQLESGVIWINSWLLRDLRTPFGGIKNSGLGREGGFEPLRLFTEEKNVCVKI